MKIGTAVTALCPIGNLNAKGKPAGGYEAVRGTYMGTTPSNERILQRPDGSQLHLPRWSGHILTTRHIDISPCGLKE